MGYDKVLEAADAALQETARARTVMPDAMEHYIGDVEPHARAVYLGMRGPDLQIVVVSGLKNPWDMLSAAAMDLKARYDLGSIDVRYITSRRNLRKIDSQLASPESPFVGMFVAPDKLLRVYPED